MSLELQRMIHWARLASCDGFYSMSVFLDDCEARLPLEATKKLLYGAIGGDCSLVAEEHSVCVFATRCVPCTVCDALCLVALCCSVGYILC